MKLKAICSAALAAAVMAATAVTASASNYDAVTDMVIPNTVTSLNVTSFGLYENLRSITIPVSVKSIITDELPYDAPGMYSHPIALTDVYYEGTRDQWNKIDTVCQSGIFWGKLGDEKFIIDPDPIFADLLPKECPAEYLFGDVTIHFKDGTTAKASDFRSSGSTSAPNHDIDGSGTVNISDVTALLKKIVSGDKKAEYDINGDGDVNISDVTTLLKIIVLGKA